MTAIAPRMDVVDDIQFLKKDNANLIKEVNSLRQQSTLLRDRNGELERKIRNSLAGGVVSLAQQQDSSIGIKRARVPDIRLKITPEYRAEVAGKVLQDDSPDVEAIWFDDPTPQEVPRRTPTERLKINDLHAMNGSQLIGEAPRATPEPDPGEQSPTRQSSFAPPSPDPSDGPSRIAVPSLLSVNAPVSGVALPDVALSLLELKLIRHETYDSPAAVASFLHKVTQTSHTPQPTYRAAFTAAFLALIPLLGPSGTVPSEWLNFLHDFPSRIPHTQRDSLVSIPWPDSILSVRGVSHSPLEPQRSHRPHDLYRSRRRSRSLDGLIHQASTIPTRQLPAPPDQHAPVPPTGVPPCERDAWVLLLALTYAAFPSSRVAAKLRKLPMAVKLQMVAWLPPGVNVYANMHFVSTAVDEALERLWDAKKEILRLKHGWP